MTAPINYLHLVPYTPLQEVYSRFFPEGFPALNLPNGLPDLYKRQCGAVFWKLDLTLMTDLQRAALRDWYHYTVRVQKVDYTVDLQPEQTDWNQLLLYRDIVSETGLESPYASYMTTEPPHLAIAYCEDAPALARYCVPQEYWQSVITDLLLRRLNRLRLNQQQSLQQRQFQVQQPPLSPPDYNYALPPELKPRLTGQPDFDPTGGSTGYW